MIPWTLLVVFSSILRLQRGQVSSAVCIRRFVKDRGTRILNVSFLLFNLKCVYYGFTFNERWF